MSSSSLPFSPSLFASHLTTQQLGRFLLYRLTTPSTQLLSKREAIEGAPNGTLILAEQQTAGKGRVDGRTWQSPPASNLYFTLLLRPSDVRDITKLNFALSLAVCRGIEQSTAAVRPRVKWPNDVWLDGRKVAGVLVDVDMMGSACTVSAGIGINVNQDWSAVADAELRESATSLLTAASDGTQQQPIVRERLLAFILNTLESLLSLPHSAILQQYTQYDCLAGREVTVMPRKKEDTQSWWQGVAVGFSDEGYLMVRKGGVGAEVVKLVAEEVTVRAK